MKYIGGKYHLAKYILPIILKSRREHQVYIEPFVGGANVIHHVNGHRIGSDINHYVIALYKALQDGWVPPFVVTESDYREYNHHREDYPPELIGFVGFACSYGGGFFNGYARGTNRNYAHEGAQSLLAIRDGIMGVEFLVASYYQLTIPSDSIIYCDPPYFNTRGYDGYFNHIHFWQWCEDQVTQNGCKVFVSEFVAPPNWKCVWHKERKTSLTKDTGIKSNIERLFTL